MDPVSATCAIGRKTGSAHSKRRLNDADPVARGLYNTAMRLKRKTRPTGTSTEAALIAELELAQARWQDLKRRARAAKAAAKDAKKTVKRLRKLLVAATEEAEAAAQAAKPIAGTPEPRTRPKRSKPSESAREPPRGEGQVDSPIQDAEIQDSTAPPAPDDSAH